MDKKTQRKLYTIIAKHPAIKLVYFHGSKADNNDGPLSDYDFACYIDEKDIKKLYEIKFKLLDKISRLLCTDNIDISILNLSEQPEFKYNVISQGNLIYEREPFRILVEPKILNQYFDFYDGLKRYGLTKA